MILAHKIALDPTVKQREYFSRAAGCDRFVWNLALEMWNAEYKAGGKPKASELKKRFNAVKYQQYPWMEEIHRDAHADPFARLQDAWGRFFKAQKKGDKRVQRPKFHTKKRGKDSFYVANDKFSLSNDGWSIRLPVVGCVRMRERLRFIGKIMGATVSRTADRWYVAIQVDVEDASRKRTGDGFAGVDLGIKNAATIITKNGANTKIEMIEAPKPLKSSLRKLRRMQRSVARRKKGGSNRAKLVRRVARLHARIAFVRKDFWNKITTRLCRENQAVGIEDLNIRGMIQNRHLSRALSDVGLGEFRRQMGYKPKLYGTRLVLAGRWYPSSKTCSRCGHVKESLLLAERVFHCDRCGHTEDRDVNSSRNLCALAESLVPTACGEITLGDNGAVMPLDEPRTKPYGRSHFRTN